MHLGADDRKLHLNPGRKIESLAIFEENFDYFENILKYFIWI